MLSIGIVGLPNVGKSTLFNALTQKAVAAENFPFTTIDPSVGVVSVPDERLNMLAEFSNSAKKVPAAIEFVDIAGLVKGAADGEGLGNKFLANIREVDAIAEVVRIFEDGDITHVSGKLDPVNDIEVINLELILADMQTLAKAKGRVEKEAKRGDKEAKLQMEYLAKLEEAFEAGKLANTVSPENDAHDIVLRDMHLLTAKPIMYILNRKTGATNLDDSNDLRYEELMKLFEDTGSHYVVVDANIEQELSELDSDDKVVFRDELGVTDDGVNNLIRKCYDMLGLMTYFTTGEDETRGWTIKKDSTAPVAGAAIHNDFKNKFIRADIINWQTLLDAGSLATAREKGQLRTEGKDYIVKDGDVIEFKV